MNLPSPDYGISFPSKKEFAPTYTAAEYSKTFLSQQISDSNYNYDISSAQLWSIKSDGTFHLLNSLPDVYELLESQFNLSDYTGIVIHTTGWAAPINESGEIDIPPSQHDSRRRVALASCVTDSSVGSALSFADDRDLISDPGSATGALAEALLKFWERNRINS